MVKLKSIAVAVVLSVGAMSGPAVALATPATAAPVIAVAHSYHHSCTRTSTGHCIRGGEFCPRSKYHKSGWDAKGRRYVCKGNRTHPHWEKP